MSPVKRTPWVWVSLPKWECGCWGSFLPIPGRWLVPLTQQVIICIFFLQLALASQHMILRKRPQSTESEGKGAYYREWPGRGTVQMNYLRCGFQANLRRKKPLKMSLWSGRTCGPPWPLHPLKLLSSPLYIGCPLQVPLKEALSVHWYQERTHLSLLVEK